MNQNFEVKTVTTAGERESFLDVPAVVYKNDPNWVPPLRQSMAKQLAPNNPFFAYGQLQQFIAISETSKQPLGRIVAAINQRLIAKENRQIGLFGYFECVENFQVAQALLNKAYEWLRERGITVVRGPIDLSTHNNCLFLTDGFDSPPTIMMPYNPSYYPKFLELDGWHKAKDAIAYDFNLINYTLPNKFEKGYKIACKSGINFRSIRLKGEGFIEDCRQIYHLFNEAFAQNWSSSPRSEEEFLEEAKDLQKLVDPDLFPVAEYQGKMIGFWMGLPDYNIALKQVNGQLNWLGMLKFLWYGRQIDRARVMAMCCLMDYRRKMVPLALIYLGMQGGKLKGKPYTKAELSWVWEDNYNSRKLIEAAGGKLSKTYRIYEKVVQPSTINYQ
ncbi:MAG: hypothetical protein DSM107014_07060 [Gomphosphaeria aponina SAG 52.96 = DSM 107014]|uniref:N-acetyltransferase domain-containing protein n=1 Tax=Gomphosphaeria aponina SAG 52.96 = DSM 107014 TaxID=1521640 RepID=A0A941GT45_9CHRO|nr:hypothetical protein [Gomphosphaeria aponina SAG 52.96 = DSM 107014]